MRMARYSTRMPDASLKILAVAGSLHGGSVTRVVILHVADRLRAEGCSVDVVDLSRELLPLLNPDTSYEHPDYPKLKARVEAADVFILGTPDYHGGMSGALKNFLDHFWREFAGKLFASVVASHEKGLTVTDQIRTVARQCYAWSLPYGVAFTDKQDVQDGKIISDTFQKRLDMMIRDARVYGEAIARQRRADLAGTDSGFLARYRK